MKYTYVTNMDMVHVTLSRRNLLTLLALLDSKSSNPSLVHGRLLVQAEEDETHYQNRAPGVGPEDVR